MQPEVGADPQDRSGRRDGDRPERRRRALSGLVLAIVLLAGLAHVALGIGLALWLGPEPHSDWLHYWHSAGNPSRYERGGVGVWLLALPKALGATPLVSALCVNVASAVVLLWLIVRFCTAGWRPMAVLSAAYLLMLAPYAGIVQLDLLASTFIAAGLCLALDPPPRWRPGVSVAAAVACLALGVSVKPQYALLIWALVGLMALPAWMWRRREPRAAKVLAILLVASLAGFALDNGLREVSGRSERLRTSSAVTLYGGLLVSRLEGCGYWSVEAAEAASADKDKPLLTAIRERLSARPLSHWIGILRCKWPQIVRPPPFALYWLVESPNIRARIDTSDDRDRINARYQRAIDVERKLYGWLTAMILLAMPLATALAWRRGARAMAWLPLAWVAAYWSVHLVFEIQGRYFLGLYLLAPLIAALVVGGWRRAGPHTPAPVRAPEPLELPPTGTPPWSSP